MSKTAASKVIMACKLHEVQKALINKKVELNLDKILPLVLDECCKQNLTFWFNFLEDACVLNIRDVKERNYELNIRYAYEHPPVDMKDIKHYKTIVLINAFNLTPSAYEFHLDFNNVDVTSSAKKEETIKHEKPIQESNIVPPRAIRAAMDTITGRGDEVTRKSIENELQLDKMSIDNRRQCIRYLKDMEE